MKKQNEFKNMLIHVYFVNNKNLLNGSIHFLFDFNPVSVTLQ